MPPQGSSRRREFDVAKSILDATETDLDTKRRAWDDFYGSTEDDFQTRFDKLRLFKDDEADRAVKAQLWDAKFQIKPPPGPPEPPKPSFLKERFLYKPAEAAAGALAAAKETVAGVKEIVQKPPRRLELGEIARTSESLGKAAKGALGTIFSPFSVLTAPIEPELTKAVEVGTDVGKAALARRFGLSTSVTPEGRLQLEDPTGKHPYLVDTIDRSVDEIGSVAVPALILGGASRVGRKAGRAAETEIRAAGARARARQAARAAPEGVPEDIFEAEMAPLRKALPPAPEEIVEGEVVPPRPTLPPAPREPAPPVAPSGARTAAEFEAAAPPFVPREVVDSIEAETMELMRRRETPGRTPEEIAILDRRIAENGQIAKEISRRPAPTIPVPAEAPKPAGVPERAKPVFAAQSEPAPPEGPPKSELVGSHFSRVKADDIVLSGARRGTEGGAETGFGAERHRLALGREVGGEFAPVPAVSIYPEGVAAQPQVATGRNEFVVRGKFAIADVATNPDWAAAVAAGVETVQREHPELGEAEGRMVAVNFAERRMAENGWGGIANSEVPSGGVVLFGDVPARRAGLPSPAETEASLRQIVVRGGGRYVGIQKAIPEAGLEAHVLFDSPETGTTLSIPSSKLTVDGVARRIAESNKEFAKYPPRPLPTAKPRPAGPEEEPPAPLAPVKRLLSESPKGNVGYQIFVHDRKYAAKAKELLEKALDEDNGRLRTWLAAYDAAHGVDVIVAFSMAPRAELISPAYLEEVQRAAKKLGQKLEVWGQMEEHLDQTWGINRPKGAEILRHLRDTGRSVLIVDPVLTDIQKVSVAETVVHELGHVFGNVEALADMPLAVLPMERLGEALDIEIERDVALHFRSAELIAEIFAMSYAKKPLTADQQTLLAALVQASKWEYEDLLPKGLKKTGDAVEAAIERKAGEAADRRLPIQLSLLSRSVKRSEFVDLARTGALKIWKGVRDFEPWSEMMLLEHGEAIRPYLPRLFQESKRQIAAEIEPVARKQAEAEAALSANPFFNPRVFAFLDRTIGRPIAEKIASALSRAFNKTVPAFIRQHLSFNKDVGDAIFQMRAEIGLKKHDLDALTEMVRAEKPSDLEKIVIDRIARGVPRDLLKLATAFPGLAAKRFKQRLAETMQTMTADLAALLGTHRPEWLEGPRHWYPQLWKHRQKVSFSMIMGRVFSRGGRALGVTRPERGALKRRYHEIKEISDRWHVIDADGKVVLPGVKEAEARAFHDENSGWFVSFHERGPNRRPGVQHRKFTTYRAAKRWMTAAQKAGEITPYTAHDKPSIEQRAYSLVEPMTIEQAAAKGLVEDAIVNIQRGGLTTAAAIAKTRALEGLSKSLASRGALQLEPTPGFVKIDEYGFRIPPELTRNEHINALAKAYVPRDVAMALGAFLGRQGGLFTRIERVPRAALTYLNPYRHIRQIFENELNLLLEDPSLFLSPIARIQAFRDFIRADWLGAQDIPYYRDFIEDGLYDTDIVAAEFAPYIDRVLAEINKQGEAGEVLTFAEAFALVIEQTPGLKRLPQIHDLLQKAYRTGDQMYKYFLYRSYRERYAIERYDPRPGLPTPRDYARDRTRKAFFDFSNEPPIIRQFRRYNPFSVGTTFQQTRININHLREHPFRFLATVGVGLWAYLYLRNELMERAGFTKEDLERMDKHAPKWYETILPVTDDYGRNYVMSLLWLAPWADVFNWVDLVNVGDEKAFNRALLRLLPLSVQPLVPLTMGVKPTGQPIERVPGPTRGLGPKIQMVGSRLKAALDEFRVGMLGQYWQRIYQNVAEKGPVTKRPWWQKAFIEPVLGSIRYVGKEGVPTGGTVEQAGRAIRGETLEILGSIRTARVAYETGVDSEKVFQDNMERLRGRADELIGRAKKVDPDTYDWVEGQLGRAFERADEPELEIPSPIGSLRPPPGEVPDFLKGVVG